MELLEAISKRRSIRAYTNEKVSETKLELLCRYADSTKDAFPFPIAWSVYQMWKLQW